MLHACAKTTHRCLARLRKENIVGGQPEMNLARKDVRGISKASIWRMAVLLQITQPWVRGENSPTAEPVIFWRKGELEVYKNKCQGSALQLSILYREGKGGEQRCFLKNHFTTDSETPCSWQGLPQVSLGPCGDCLKVWLSVHHKHSSKVCTVSVFNIWS